jgi:hypothetical protein
LFLPPQFQVDHGDALFNLIIDLIKRDPNRKGLLKVIYFSGASASPFMNYFAMFLLTKQIMVSLNLSKQDYFTLFSLYFNCLSNPNSIIIHLHAKRKKMKKNYSLPITHFKEASNPCEPDKQFVRAVNKWVLSC